MLNIKYKKINNIGGFISLPRARIHKKEATKKLNNLPINFVECFCKDWVNEIDFSGEIDFQNFQIDFLE